LLTVQGVLAVKENAQAVAACTFLQGAESVSLQL